MPTDASPFGLRSAGREIVTRVTVTAWSGGAAGSLPLAWIARVWRTSAAAWGTRYARSSINGRVPRG
jgi:hypothetical protein